MRPFRNLPPVNHLNGTIGATFAVLYEERTVTQLTLESIDRRDGAQQGWESGSLVFSGPADPVLEAGIHRLDHPDTGYFDVSLEPTWASSGEDRRMFYNAVFNRPMDRLAVNEAASKRPSGRRSFLGKVGGVLTAGGILSTVAASSASASTSRAGISGMPNDPFIAEITMFAGNFAPNGWAFCQGQLLPIAQNQALFSLVGTFYGGDGRTTFGLPDLRGRTPIGAGQGSGLSSRSLGATGGAETVTLGTTQIPAHNHSPTLPTSSSEPNVRTPSGNVLATPPNTRGTVPAFRSGGSDGSITISNDNVGGGQAHENMPPYQVINYIIALTGTFPSQ